MQLTQRSLIFLVTLAACAEGPSPTDELSPVQIASNNAGNETASGSAADASMKDAGSQAAQTQPSETYAGPSDAGAPTTDDGAPANDVQDASASDDASTGPDIERDAAGPGPTLGRDAGSRDSAVDPGPDDAGPSPSPEDAGVSGDASDASALPNDDGGVWRPFSATSPWNTLIGENPALAPDSDALVADLRNSSQYGAHLDINIAKYSVPLYYATANTPTTDVVCDLGGLGFSSTNGSNAHALVPIPAGATPDPESDHHIAIIDRQKNVEWGMWNAVNESGSWKCGVGATADLAGDGLRPYKPNNPTWYTSHGARACGFPLIAGLIRTEEIDAGRIDHALVIAYPHIRAGFYMSPASTGQARIGDDSISTRGIPCGGHVQLDPNLDLDSLGLSRAGRIVAEALQRYGAFVGDYSGAINLYAENSPAAQEHWQGILQTYEFMDKLDLSDFRVLEFGQLTDDGNGG